MGPTVLIVDDHADFRSLARELLEADGFQVVGDAADGESALRASRRLRPEVVLLDVQLPDTDGFAVAGALALGPEPPSVVLVSSRRAADYGPRVEAAAVRGFLTKDALTAAALTALLA